MLEAGSAGGAAARALGGRRAAAATHEDAGRVGVDLSVGLGVERRLPATPIPNLVARPRGPREKPESNETDQREDEHERIHQRRVSAVARSERAIAWMRSMSSSCRAGSSTV